MRSAAMTKRRKKMTEDTVSDVLKRLSHEELLDFTIGLVEQDPDLSNRVMLQFSDRIENSEDSGGNKYRAVLRDAFNGLSIDEEEYRYMYDDWLSIDFLDEWLMRADKYSKEGNCSEAGLIARACIEEFARWISLADQEYDYGYAERMFLRLKESAGEADRKELYEYCRAEVRKPQYASGVGELADCFNDLMRYLAPGVDAEGFLALQDELLAKVEDKGSREAEKILRRKVDLYRSVRKRNKAWEILKSNKQIESFRKEWVEHLIKGKDFSEARRLIQEFLDARGEWRGSYRDDWHEMLLGMAREEGDKGEVRRIAFLFIKNTFDEAHYRIYKGTFTPEEWAVERQHIAAVYEQTGSSLAAFYRAEGDMPALLACLREHPDVHMVMEYYKMLAESFPEETVALFREAIDRFVEGNKGRSRYEEAVGYMKRLAALPGGKAAVAGMAGRYRGEYKNRRALMEILNRAFKG